MCSEGWGQADGSAARRQADRAAPIVLPAGQSRVLDAPWPVKGMSITKPETADAEAISPTQVLIMGRRIGSTDLVLWSAGGETWQRRIDVDVDLPRLTKELTALFPGSGLDVTQSQDVVIVTGSLSNRVQADRLNRFLEAAAEATGLKYVDMVTVVGAPHMAARTQEELGELFPGSQLEVRQSGDVIIVSGVLRRTEQVEQLRKYLEAQKEAAEQRARMTRGRRSPAATAPAGAGGDGEAGRPELPLEAMGYRYVDMTSVAGVQQVQIEVRVAEASRTALRSLGVNILQTGHHDNTFFGGSMIGASAGGALVPMSIGPARGTIAGNEGVPFTFNADVNVSPAVTLFFGFPRADLEFFIQALAENSYLRLLAEPSLVALSGEEASFLAGGEFPIPVVQSSAGGVPTISIQWKEFGVRLRFRPTVLGDGTIRLHLAPEVSELAEIGGVVIQGFSVPTVAVRRAETTLELKSGQSFAMAGLLSSRNDARNSRTPGLGDVPVLGALFRSVRYLKGETELVVLVTATLVEPLSLAAAPALPGATHAEPNDWELYAEGVIEGRSAPKLSDAEAEWLDRLGLDDLRGPGAWETYEQGGAPSRSTMMPLAPEAAGAVLATAPAAE